MHSLRSPVIFQPVGSLTDQFHDAVAAAPARSLIFGCPRLQKPPAHREGQEEVGGRRPEELLQQFQGSGDDVVIPVLSVMETQLVHLEGGGAQLRFPL